MENYRDYFWDYLRKLGLHNARNVEMFEMYSTELQLANQFINLFSRQMRPAEIWCKHFVDSVSIFEVFRDFAGKNVLDFGTGGGLPGIPIKIVEPKCNVTLLDSTKKKIETVRNILIEMKIDGVDCISNRIESPDMSKHYGTFDFIVSRGIRILPLFNDAFKNLLKPGGKVFLYKANIQPTHSLTREGKKAEIPALCFSKPHHRCKVNEDLSFIKDMKVHNLDLNILGERKIIEIKYG